MNHDEISELLGAYALDAVDDDERRVVEEHLVACARCRAEVAEHREVATFLAHTGGDAPEGVWDRIAGALDEPPPELRLAPAPMPPRPDVDVVRTRRGAPSRVALAALAAAAAVVVALGFEVRRQDDRIDELQLALQDPLAPAFQAAIEDGDSRVLELTSADGELLLRGAVTEDGVGYLPADALPDLEDGRTYQLWGAAGGDLVSLGVLGDDPAIVSFAAEPYEAFAITEEDAPGVVVSEADPVVAGTVS